MPAKGTYDPGAAIASRFRLEVIGLPPINFSRVGEITRTLLTVDLPDRTRQTSGEVEAGELEVDMLLHQRVEHLAMSAWFADNISGGLTGKKPGILYFLRADGTVVRALALQGLQPTAEKTPELDAGGDPSAIMCTWTLSYDDVTWLPV